MISGRIGVTDAELMVKKYQPVFDAEDLTKLPNYQFVASVMINGMPSAPFSMAGIPPMAKKNPQLADAMKRLSGAKYGFERAIVEKEIFARLEPPKPKPSLSAGGAKPGGMPAPGRTGSFLDEWLAKRQKQPSTTPQPARQATTPGASATPSLASAQPQSVPPPAPQLQSMAPQAAPTQPPVVAAPSPPPSLSPTYQAPSSFGPGQPQQVAALTPPSYQPVATDGYGPVQQSREAVSEPLPSAQRQPMGENTVPQQPLVGGAVEASDMSADPGEVSVSLR